MSERKPRRHFQDDYEEALKLGEVLVAYARVMSIGPGGVGKSSLLRGLLNLPPPPAESTILAETLRLQCRWVSAGSSSESHWSEMDEEDELKELARLARIAVHNKGSAIVSMLTSLSQAVAIKVFHPLRFTPPTPAKPDAAMTRFRQKAADAQESIAKVVTSLNRQQYEDPLASPAEPEVETMLHMWDCGGQPVFLDVLPAFLTGRTMFLLLFDARKELTSLYESICNHNGREVARKATNTTILQLLVQWMASIHATLTKHTPSGKIQEYPRIMAIGTHGDNDQVKERREQILHSLTAQFENKAFAPLLVDSAIVDNTSAGKGEHEDKAFKYIRKEIHKFATSKLAVRTPVAWVHFRKVFQRMARECPIIEYEQAVAVGEACGIPASVVPSVLNFYHELAVFLHYTSIGNLGKFIIADPQWLIEKFGKLLALEGRETVRNEPLWKLFREKGILVQPLYEEVWKGSEIPPREIMNLLEHFLLAAQINSHSQIHHYDGHEYFVPSMLENVSTSYSPPEEAVKHASPLHLVFSTEYVPPGFFVRLVIALTKEPSCQLRFKQAMFRNRVIFFYGEEKIDQITVTECETSIQIDIARLAHREQHIPMFRATCQEVLILIQACSADVREWLPSIKVEVALQCEQCQQSGAAQCLVKIPPKARSDSYVPCEGRHRYSHYSQPQQYWLMMPEVPNGAISELELSAIAEEVKTAEELESLADVLEMMVALPSVKDDPNPALTLLSRWCHDMGTQSRSQLIHYLRSIKMEATAERLRYREFPSIGHGMSSRDTDMPSSHLEEPLTDVDFRVCARFMEKDLPHLADELDVSPEEMEDIQSKFKNTRGQARQLLKHWYSTQGGSRRELIGILNTTGFTAAAKVLLKEPNLKDVLDHVTTTRWYRLGLQLGVDDYQLAVIQEDTRGDIEESRKRMLREWLRSCERPSWTDVTMALRTIGEKKLAADLERKFAY